jgi:hypothetical protein
VPLSPVERSRHEPSKLIGVVRLHHGRPA